MRKLFSFIIILFAYTFCQSQTVTVKGVAKDSLKINNFIGIVINDTIRKFRDKASEDEEFQNKNWDKYDELKNKYSTSPDFPDGNYTINAKLTDTLYFSKRDYTTKKYKVEDIIKNKIRVILKPRPCIPFEKCDQKKPSKLYSFVGKKINISSLDHSKYCGISLSREYKAEYQIEKQLSDNYSDSTIIFTAYDHNNSEEYVFENYDHILLFVGEYCGKLVKDFFFPVYKTKNGKWAYPIKPKDEHYYEADIYKPVKINFDKSVYFDVTNLPVELIKYRYPKEYYKIQNGKAFPIKGRYADDLVKLWKEIENKPKNGI